MFRFVSRGRQHGFTLIELLVVVAIIAIVAGLLMPALSRSKARAQAITCRNNYKQLAFAWTMYSDDNNMRLAYNVAPNPATMSYVSSATPNWINNIMDWEASPANTNVGFVTISILGNYTSWNANVFHCPADHAVSQVQRGLGWSYRVRSVSMNAMVGDIGDAGMFQNGVNIQNPGYQQFLTESDFRDPASVFVFLDEHPDSIDDGYFQNNAENLEWLDLPGSYHNGCGSFTFADGHTEIHRWQSGTTIRPPVAGAAALPMAVNPNDQADFDWVIRHTSTQLR